MKLNLVRLQGPRSEGAVVHVRQRLAVPGSSPAASFVCMHAKVLEELFIASCRSPAALQASLEQCKRR